MSRIATILLGVLLITLMSACATASTSTPAMAPTPTTEPSATVAPSATPVPSETPEPTITPVPPPTPIPTPKDVAPEETFMLVGSVAEFSGEHDISGKAIIAGLQTMIIQRFSFDGKGPQIDIRLTLDGEIEGSVATLMALEQRLYENETVIMRIPPEAGPGTANSITVYCPETDTVYATAKFR